ncbi:hypothetical protein [Xenorhabdus bovienii]|uniref:Uncharacterized protein n=1 Tax=Xenorhabdus bovienii str. Intermedium TaxID=1379677 RepID=A0A077QAQ5_XENBV|nr:hypothetical protein [Xenorhabdus bovienii]MDE9483894.1 hypothetical protein [Xenorhabdus bovienii]MDE9540651.1 hypothetical protein [Xenorhabdus bovienii]MDE9553302.1 hypothetical protein [Xenorhabdus bovienii]CDH33287.1 conserved hypothetical protein [Xenorhabdus bovienii str. Intermedium]
MASEEVVFTFYEVRQCGYYKSGEQIPTFGNLAELLEDVFEWAEGKTLRETSTFEADEKRLPCYLLNAKKIGNDWLLTIWNEIPSNGQKVPSIREDLQFGEDPNVIMNPIEEGSIPGYATYFWFLTDKKLFATIRLRNRLTSQKFLQHYLYSFLKQSSSHVVSATVENENGEPCVLIRGYKLDPLDENEKSAHYFPRFDTKLIRNPGEHEIIRQNADRIRKIERVIELNLSTPEDLGFWQQLLVFIKLRSEREDAPNTKVRYVLSPNVSLSDINNMIDDWEQQRSENSDYGFIFEGDPNKTYWLSNSLARTEYNLEFERDNDELVNVDSLLNALIEKRSIILNRVGV